MQQPVVGFINLDFSHHVCKLKKSIYGLKQAPRAWYSKLSSWLSELGFHAAVSNPSLFIYHSNSATVYVLIYVDDKVVTASNSAHITDFIYSCVLPFQSKI